MKISLIWLWLLKTKKYVMQKVAVRTWSRRELMKGLDVESKFTRPHAFTWGAALAHPSLLLILLSPLSFKTNANLQAK